MRRTLFPTFLLCLLLGFSAREILVVKVQKTALRTEPRFFAPVKGTLKFGDQMEKLILQEGWFQVKTAEGLSGWVHSSAVQQRSATLALLAKGPKTGPTASEVALASKGFNRHVETSFRQRHPEVDYTWVDRLLSFKTDEPTMARFLKEGHLGDWKEAK